MLDIVEATEDALYSEVLQTVIRELGGKEILRLDYDSDYQGHVDIDVLLDNGSVFSYKYWYGSCSGCDEWESRDLTAEEIKDVMIQEATFFDSLGGYKTWIEMRGKFKRTEDDFKLTDLG